MFTTSLCGGGSLPRTDPLVLLLVMLSLVGGGCSDTPPTGVEPERVPHPNLRNHVPWTGCTAWDGFEKETVYFDKGSAELDAVDRAALDRNVITLNLCPGDGVHVKGMAACEKHALQVAAARARVVADYYADHGLASPGRISTSSFINGGGCGKRWGSPDQARATETY